MTERMRRVNEAIREALAEALVDLKDPRIGFVTITGVKTSTDLRHARVFVSVLGNERKREKTLQGLQSAHGVLQAKLATELRMKRTPLLAFEFDPSVQEGMRMSQLIDELAPEGRDEAQKG
jgi:ribosome-binding factor A